MGLVVTLEAPSALSVGLCLTHMATDKRAWLERLDVWPMGGKPGELYMDNAAEFKSEALRWGRDQHGVRLRWRPPGQPHYGGIIERVIGTMMEAVHELPGTTFSNPVSAENLVRAAQAARSYSWRSPPRRSCRWMRRCVIVARSVMGWGSGRSGRAFAMPRWGRFML